MDEDDLIAHLSGGQGRELGPVERAEVDRLRAALADPAVWAEPSPELQERVVAAIADAAPSRRRWIRYAVTGAAAAVVLAVGLVFGLDGSRDDSAEFTATLEGTELAADATGDVTLTKTASGWEIRLHATGLPRRTDGQFYEAWLKNEAGVLVPLGTFNEGEEVTLWSGVGPADFPTLTVTRELDDGNQASSGEIVLVGAARRS
jgi:hypothetical protein